MHDVFVLYIWYSNSICDYAHMVIHRFLLGELTVKHLAALDKPKVQNHFGTRSTKFKDPGGISTMTKT